MARFEGNSFSKKTFEALLDSMTQEEKEACMEYHMSADELLALAISHDLIRLNDKRNGNVYEDKEEDY